jgi:cardiolipin synthase
VEAVEAAEGLANMPTLRGNSVELLVDGSATFESILKGIEEAKEYVLIQFFIVKNDNLGRTLQEHLIAKAREGLRVLFLYDEVGCHELPKRYIDDLRAAGVDMRAFNTRKGRRNRFQLNFRNHRKVVVTDGKVAWIGGHNVGDEYLGMDPKFGHWRDTHVRIEGPAVLKAQISFAEDWYWATETLPEFEWTAHPASNGDDANVLIMPTGPADELETCNLMFVHAINSATERIWIASPYFVPEHAVMVALQLAGLRGVDVRILIPDKPDHLLVFLAAYSYFDEAGLTGAKFYRYQDGFLHQKAMLIDDAVATVGTANFDNRSFRLNFEITAAIAEPKFVAEVEEMFERDFKHSRQMRQGEYDEKPWYFRLGVRLARLTSPIQ